MHELYQHNTDIKGDTGEGVYPASMPMTMNQVRMQAAVGLLRSTDDLSTLAEYLHYSEWAVVPREKDQEVSYADNKHIGV